MSQKLRNLNVILLFSSCSIVSNFLWSMECSGLGFPVLHYLLEFAQTHVHWVGDAIQPSHPVTSFSSCSQSCPASECFPMSWLFASGGQSIGVLTSSSVLSMNIQDWFPLGWTGWSPCSPRDSQESSSAPQFKSINSSLLSLPYGPNSHIHTWLLEKP